MLSRGGKRTVSDPVRGQQPSDFETLLEAVPDALMGVDRDGVIRFANGQTESLFGYGRDDLVGRLVETLVPGSGWQVHRMHHAHQDSHLKPLPIQVLGNDQGRRRDGTESPVEVALSPMGTGQERLVIAAVRDLVVRMTIDAELERLLDTSRPNTEKFFALSLDLLCICGADGYFKQLNPAWTTTLGYQIDELLGQPFASFIHPDDPELPMAGLAEGLGDALMVSVQNRYRCMDGSYLWVLWNAVAVPDEGLVYAVGRDNTDQRQVFEDAQRAAVIVENSDDAIIGKALDGIITSWNPAAERMYGYSSQEIVGRSIDLLAPEGRADEINSILTRVRAGQPVDHFETIRVGKDGTSIAVSINVSPIRDEDGAIVGASTIARDMTEQRKATKTAQSLVAAEELVRSVLASAPIGIILAAPDGSFRVVNRWFCDLLGYEEAWLLAHRIDDIVHPDDLGELHRRRARVIAGRESTVLTQRLVRADGSPVWVRRALVLVSGGDGQPDLLMVQVEDITTEREAHEALAHQAFHDQLTGLHNRAWILDILQVDLPAAKRLGTRVGALFVDLDNFKLVNDSLGHAAGDEVLVAVAGRIEAALCPGDRVGRLGGDEFVIVVQDVQEGVDVERCAERVIASITADLQVQGHRIVPSASIGIAVSTSLSTPDSLLRDADSALFRAKAAGRARWHFFDAAMHAQAVVRLTIEEQLRDAITRDEFVVHYQPIVALADAHVVGHEALVRWAHPTRGLLKPADFLDVAEDTGLINAIGARVLDQVCATLAARLDLPGTVSVNVSARQLAEPAWLGGFRETLTRHQVDPTRIVIEVTETAVLSLLDTGVIALEFLHRLGVGIHVDDFGTGYSSISLLRDLPVTGVKLDLRFVHDLTEGDSQANALALGLSGLVNGMHLTGIAEGVETQTQADILRAQGWQCGQGHYFGRPEATPAAH